MRITLWTDFPINREDTLMIRYFYLIALTMIGAATIIGSASAPDNTWAREQFQETIPVCTGEKQCERMWSAAQIWVAKNAAMKIQVATNSVIETYNSTSWSNLAVRVIKQPVGEDSYKFEVSTFCKDNTCIGVDPWVAALDFNRSVNSAGEAL